MSHGLIIQTCTYPLNKRDWVDEEHYLCQDFVIGEIADYVSDLTDKERKDCLIGLGENGIPGIEINQSTDKMTITSKRKYFDERDSWTPIYFDDYDGIGFCDMDEFVSHYNDGDEFYICGVVDYHY